MNTAEYYQELIELKEIEIEGLKSRLDGFKKCEKEAEDALAKMVIDNNISHTSATWKDGMTLLKRSQESVNILRCRLAANEEALSMMRQSCYYLY